MSEHQAKSGEDQGLCQRVDELLRYRKHEEPNRRSQRMAVPTNSHVYLEAVETAKDKETASHQSWDTGLLCAHGGKQSKRLLENGKHNNGQTSVVKRKTDTLRLL